MLKFLVAVEAKHGPIVEFESPHEIEGYCQTLGVTARNQAELVQLVRDFIYQDLESQLVKIYEMWVPDFESEDAEIKELCGDTSTVGIWYHSSHAWFSADENGGDISGEG